MKRGRLLPRLSSLCLHDGVEEGRARRWRADRREATRGLSLLATGSDMPADDLH